MKFLFFCVDRFQTVLQTAQASGEFEKIMQGLYENYLESKAKDVRMDRVSEESECGLFVRLHINVEDSTQSFELERKK